MLPHSSGPQTRRFRLRTDSFWYRLLSRPCFGVWGLGVWVWVFRSGQRSTLQTHTLTLTPQVATHKLILEQGPSYPSTPHPSTTHKLVLQQRPLPHLPHWAEGQVEVDIKPHSSLVSSRRCKVIANQGMPLRPVIQPSPLNPTP